MAAALDGRTRIHWESTGDGPPVLLIMGLGLSGGAWWRTVPVLSRSLRVITFDHRGIGRSESATPAYTIEAMADDAVCVIDDLGLDAVHVYGFSLGGMVAQQMALRHPERVRVARARRHPPRRPARRTARGRGRWRSSGGAPDDAAARRPPGRRSPTTTARAAAPRTTARIAEDIARRLAQPVQRAAPTGRSCTPRSLHNCLGRLGRIGAPTLVVHGAEDRMIPVANAQLLADGIPGAQLRVLEESGHLYPTDEPGVDAEIGAFIEAH